MSRFVHPGNLSLEHIPRVGYVSLFPFLLNLVDERNVEKMSHVLDMMESPDLLWTEFGLRSIAKTDKFYRKMNAAGDQPYWRGPIWINVNYMALASLFRYRQRLSESGSLRSAVNKVRHGCYNSHCKHNVQILWLVPLSWLINLMRRIRKSFCIELKHFTIS